MKFGKWIGGGLGWAFFGPIGALLGFALGAAVDNITITSPQTSHSPTQQGDFIASLLVLTAAVMKADGKILKSELDYVKRTFMAQFPEEQARQYMLMLRDILKQDIPVQEVCQQIKHYMDYSARLQLLHYLYGISSSDGELHSSELNVIEQIAAGIGISQADLSSIKAMFVKDTDSMYKILEIEPTASNEEVKKAYR
ncbi:MAG: TerB family tellurite resistance protein, partial [Bacteroidota bacterium]